MLRNINKFLYKQRNLLNISQKNFRSTNTLNKKLSVGEAAVVLEQRISGISQVNDLKEYGSVISIGDGIARVFGLTKVQAGEMVEFSSGIKGMALNLETDNVGIVVLGNDR
jgi:F-type H+-transporting ATPase subunit alpha